MKSEETRQHRHRKIESWKKKKKKKERERGRTLKEDVDMNSTRVSMGWRDVHTHLRAPCLTQHLLVLGRGMPLLQGAGSPVEGKTGRDSFTSVMFDVNQCYAQHKLSS